MLRQLLELIPTCLLNFPHTHTHVPCTCTHMHTDAHVQCTGHCVLCICSICSLLPPLSLPNPSVLSNPACVLILQASLSTLSRSQRLLPLWSSDSNFSVPSRHEINNCLDLLSHKPFILEKTHLLQSENISFVVDDTTPCVKISKWLPVACGSASLTLPTKRPTVKSNSCTRFMLLEDSPPLLLQHCLNISWLRF